VPEDLKHRGGDFLVRQAEAAEVFAPEDFDEEQRAMRKGFREFGEKEGEPRREEIETCSWDVTKPLVDKAAELGLFMAEVPEGDGGLGLSLPMMAGISEATGDYGSVGNTFIGHMIIGMLPLVYWGAEKQKEKYLPGCMDGSTLCAYALTEPGAGSDALSVSSTARLSPDGEHYILDGTKQFITNAGWADLFTLFAKVDGKKFTAFLVERDSLGIDIGAEERKMGLKGSSTCSIQMRQALVPVDNVLGEIGQGHRIALNILNLGRLRIAASGTGYSRKALSVATRYAMEREQFGKTICEFGLIQHKLGEMAARHFAAETIVFRVAGLVQEAMESFAGAELTPGEAKMNALREFASECALVKIFATESMGQVIDEAVQIHGGYGYVEEYAVSRMYRDARVQRVYEGTNEICRLSAMSTILKSVAKGDLDLRGVVEAPDASGLKKTFAHIAAIFCERYPEPALAAEHQELLACLADIAIDAFVAESVALRARKIGGSHGEDVAKLYDALASLCADACVERTRARSATALAALSLDYFEEQRSAVEKWLPAAVDTIALRRLVATELIKRNGALPELQNT